VACSIFHEGAARPSLARIRITYDEFKAVDPISALVCAQCENAPCMEACPVDAMRRDERTGAVLVDEELCIGCMQCREACPWEIPVLHPEKGGSIKCDLCGDREGGPACVAWCPLSGRALRYVQDDTTEGADA
jgi:Fe-S-cluster-containing hydrogenase component 2